MPMYRPSQRLPGAARDEVLWVCPVCKREVVDQPKVVGRRPICPDDGSVMTPIRALDAAHRRFVEE